MGGWGCGSGERAQHKDNWMQSLDPTPRGKERTDSKAVL